MWSRTEGEGCDIVFLHGWAMDHRGEMSIYEPAFQGRTGWRRHYLDLPGMGRSPAQPEITNMDGMLEALIDFIEAKLAGRRFLLAGASAGGYLARGILAQLGDRIDGVLLRVPLIVAPDARRDVDPVRPIIVNSALMDALSAVERGQLGNIPIQTSDYVETIRARTQEIVAPARALADEAFLSPIRQDPTRYAFSFEVDTAMSPFPRPSLIVTGRLDASVGYRDAWRLIEKFPRATFVLMDRAEHGLPVDQQALFTSLVGEWLDRVVEDRRERGVG